KLILAVYECSSFDPTKILLDFSSQVRSMSIAQHEIIVTDSCLFGRINEEYEFEYSLDVDWVSVIIEMLSRKVDKIYIENDAYPDYLSYENAIELTQRLPLLGKKIWLSVSFGRHKNENSKLLQ
ncbi:hypothetical protein PENTCL1PPCAC_16804, partial [Pristionchus entomophagus]